MGKKSFTGIPNRKEQAEEPYVVKEPGSNPPTARDVKRRMIEMITSNAEDIVQALIALAAKGHYQAGQYLLNTMSELSLEQEEEGGRSIGESLLPAMRFLAARYREQITNAGETESEAEKALLAPLDQIAVPGEGVTSNPSAQ